MCAVTVSMSSYTFNSFDKSFHGSICTGYGRVPWTVEEICSVPTSHLGASWLVVYISGGVGCGMPLLYILGSTCGWLVALVSLGMELHSMGRGNISVSMFQSCKTWV